MYTVNVNTKYDSIPVTDMNDGEIAIITKWGSDVSNIGTVVKRVNTKLVNISGGAGSEWSLILQKPYIKTIDNYRVRQLIPGDRIIIEVQPGIVKS